jgi:hypothetical protein
MHTVTILHGLLYFEDEGTNIFGNNSYSEKPNNMQQCIKILLFLILSKAQHVSGVTPPIIRSLKLHKQPLVLHTWKVAGCAVVGLCQVAYTLPDNVQQPSTHAKPEAASVILGS